MLTSLRLFFITLPFCLRRVSRRHDPQVLVKMFPFLPKIRGDLSRSGNGTLMQSCYPTRSSYSDFNNCAAQLHFYTPPRGPPAPRSPPAPHRSPPTPPQPWPSVSQIRVPCRTAHGTRLPRPWSLFQPGSTSSACLHCRRLHTLQIAGQ